MPTLTRWCSVWPARVRGGGHAHENTAVVRRINAQRSSVGAAHLDAGASCARTHIRTRLITKPVARTGTSATPLWRAHTTSKQSKWRYANSAPSHRWRYGGNTSIDLDGTCVTKIYLAEFTSARPLSSPLTGHGTTEIPQAVGLDLA